MKLKFAAPFALAAGFAAFATPAEEHKDKMKNVSVTGCLAMGAVNAPNEFVITEDGTGRRVTVTGSNLAKHNNHKVKLTGDRDAQNADRMTVTKVEHISDSCSAK